MSDIRERLGDLIQERYQHRMEGLPELEGETLLIRFDSGLTLELQPAMESDFTYSWAWSSPDWGLETDFLGWDYKFRGQDMEEQPAVRGRITPPASTTWPDLRAILDAMFKDNKRPQMRL